MRTKTWTFALTKGFRPIRRMTGGGETTHIQRNRRRLRRVQWKHTRRHVLQKRAAKNKKGDFITEYFEKIGHAISEKQNREGLE